MRRAAAAAIAATLALVGCATPAVESDPAIEGARAAVVTYVDAIAALDLDAATSMTSPEALVAPVDRTPPADVTTALPQAIAPLEDPWIAYEGTDLVRLDEDASDTTTDVVSFTVSYTVDGIAGADSVAVTRTGDDPGDATDWVVTDPLIVRAESFVDDAIATSSFGGVELDAPLDAYQPVWGYPGLYVHEATAFAASAPSGATATALEVPVGVVAEPRWDESLRMLRLDEE